MNSEAIIIWVHASTKGSDEEEKDQYYELLEDVFDKQPIYDIKLKGDMKAKVGIENTTYIKIK